MRRHAAVTTLPNRKKHLKRSQRNQAQSNTLQVEQMTADDDDVSMGRDQLSKLLKLATHDENKLKKLVFVFILRS